MAALRLFTSESVTEGHPDKICDQISDSILDALIEQDPNSRVAVETLVTTGLVHVAGEVTTAGYADIPGIVRRKIKEIGYDSSEKSFDAEQLRCLRLDRLRSRPTSPGESIAPSRPVRPMRRARASTC